MEETHTLTVEAPVHIEEPRTTSRRASTRRDKHTDAATTNHRTEPIPMSQEAALREILDELRMIRRLRQHGDFSFGHLVGSIAQAFALCALAWALYAAMGDYKMAYVDASLRILFAIAFQLIALTGFLSGGRK